MGDGSESAVGHVERGRPGSRFVVLGAENNSTIGTLSTFASRTKVLTVKFSLPASTD